MMLLLYTLKHFPVTGDVVPFNSSERSRALEGFTINPVADVETDTREFVAGGAGRDRERFITNIKS